MKLYCFSDKDHNPQPSYPDVLTALKDANGFILWQKTKDSTTKINADQLLFSFAKQRALSVIDLWPMPKCVRVYLLNDDFKMYEAQDAVRQRFWWYTGSKHSAAWASGWAATFGGYWYAAYAAAKAMGQKEVEDGGKFRPAFNSHWQESSKILNNMVERKLAVQM